MNPTRQRGARVIAKREKGIAAKVDWLLFDAIRNDKPYNEAETGALSTMTGIMGRMATYTGQQIEWDEAFNSKTQLVPPDCDWNTPPPVLPDAEGWYPVAMPGKGAPPV